MILITLYLAAVVFIVLVAFIAITRAYQRGYDDGHHASWRTAKGPTLPAPGEPQRDLPFGIEKARKR